MAACMKPFLRYQCSSVCQRDSSGKCCFAAVTTRAAGAEVGSRKRESAICCSAFSSLPSASSSSIWPVLPYRPSYRCSRCRRATWMPPHAACRDRHSAHDMALLSCGRPPSRSSEDGARMRSTVWENNAACQGRRQCAKLYITPHPGPFLGWTKVVRPLGTTPRHHNGRGHA